MEDKYNLTLEENIFLAKKMLVSNIYSSAKLEGCNVTFPETQTILDGVNVPSVTSTSIPSLLFLKSLIIPKKKGPPASISINVAKTS